MINADEHKNLLEQINELEKNSINYFDVEKEFFLIDSDNLSQVRPKLYGYSIQQSGIYENDDLTAEAIAGLDGRGCYVYVEVKDGKITIKQDLNGSWGIYLFRHGDYFALSNSFFRLVDYVKFKYPLTVNRDYFHHLFIARMFSHSETAVNEIQRIDRSAIIHIDTTNRILEIELIDYKEYTIPIDSEEGIAALDRWVEFWSDFFRGLAKQTNYITVELSGGFDSRTALVPVLNSGIDLNKIQVHSRRSILHTYKEDYEIASKIAEHYGFKLNQPLPDRRFVNYSLFDAFNIDLHIRQTFDKILALQSKNFVEKSYTIGGLGGEVIRGYWTGSPKEFLDKNNWISQFFSFPASSTLLASIEKILNVSFQEICDKYKIKDPDSKEIVRRLFLESENPTHFGKYMLISYFHNKLYFPPILDPELLSLQLDVPECPDPNLLVALLFVRYQPDLLTFPFNSGHEIKPETIEYAKKINELFPRPKDVTTEMEEKYFYLSPLDKKAKQILILGRNNPKIPESLPGECLKAIFDSNKTYGLFTTCFDEELYHYAANFYENHVFGRDRNIYAIVGITKVLELVEISQHNHSSCQDIKHFLEKNFYRLNGNTCIADKFKPYLTARIDVRLVTKPEGSDFKLLSVSDNKANVILSPRFRAGDLVYQVHSFAGQLNFIVKATADGKVYLNLRGLDIRDPKDNSKSIPHWIDYTKLAVNNEIIFDTITPAWARKSYDYTMDAKANEEIKIEIEWLPHRSDT